MYPYSDVLCLESCLLSSNLLITEKTPCFSTANQPLVGTFTLKYDVTMRVCRFRVLIVFHDPDRLKNAFSAISAGFLLLLAVLIVCVCDYVIQW